MRPWSRATAALRASVQRFLFTPAGPRPLAALRIGLALVLLAQLYAVAGRALDLFSSTGYMQGDLNDYITGAWFPSLHFLVSKASRYVDLTSAQAVRMTLTLYAASVMALLIGWRTRVAAVATCVLHAELLVSGYMTAYGVDQFAQVGLFYLAVGQANGAWAIDRWDARAGSRDSDRPTVKQRLVLRGLQIHLCIAYAAAGLAKMRGEQWWSGEAIWRALMMPEYARLPMAWLAQWPWLAAALCWGTLLIEGGYAVFIWPRRTRIYWIVAVVLLHAGIAVGLGLTFFSLTMTVMTVAAFGFESTPQRVAAAAPNGPMPWPSRGRGLRLSS